MSGFHAVSIQKGNKFVSLISVAGRSTNVPSDAAAALITRQDGRQSALFNNKKNSLETQLFHPGSHVPRCSGDRYSAGMNETAPLFISGREPRLSLGYIAAGAICDCTA
jgi:hypothetical protein